MTNFVPPKKRDNFFYERNIKTNRRWVQSGDR